MSKRKTSSLSDFDFAAFEEEAIRQLYDGKPVSGKGGVFTPLIKRIIEKAMQGESEAHLDEEGPEARNRRNGRTSKTMKSEQGSRLPVTVTVPLSRR